MRAWRKPASDGQGLITCIFLNHFFVTLLVPVVWRIHCFARQIPRFVIQPVFIMPPLNEDCDHSEPGEVGGGVTMVVVPQWCWWQARWVNASFIQLSVSFQVGVPRLTAAIRLSFSPSFFSLPPPFPSSLPLPVTKRCGAQKREMIDDESGRQNWVLGTISLSLPLTTCKEGLEGRKKRPLVMGQSTQNVWRMDGSETTPIRWWNIFHRWMLDAWTFPLQKLSFLPPLHPTIYR